MFFQTMVCIICARLIVYKALAGAREANVYEETFDWLNNMIKEQ